MTDPAALQDPRPPKPRPAPVPDADSAPYWSGGLEGRLMIQRCVACGHHQLYGRRRCLVCGAQVEWVEASGKGQIYSYTIIRQNFQRPFKDMVPYVVALVDLDEGPRVMTNIVDCDPEVVSIGQRVRARFEPVSEEAGIALFAPEAQTPRS
jgi:uncharacterized OB-fold protein